MQNQQPSTLKEIRVHGTQDFPCAFYQTGTRIKGNMVKHHWHEEVELLYFSGGEFCLEVNMERFNISEECFYFINVFGGDSFRENYYDGEAVTDDITRQLFIKSALLRILAVLSANNLFEVTEKNHDHRIETIKTTLTYIQENYKEKIYIRDLAGLIGMNEQYFCRFFKKVIGRSPMEYVNEYRIKKAIHYLKESDLTVTEICLECGYNNLGNFLREFRKYTSTTPLQYRRHSLKETQ